MADFIEQLCFSKEMSEHRWRLHYPKNVYVEDSITIQEDIESESKINELINDFKQQIIDEGRATISTTYTPISKWVESEIHYVNAIDAIRGKMFIKTNHPIYKNSAVELNKLPEKMPFYQNQDVESRKDLKLLEFLVNYNDNEISINHDSVTVDSSSIEEGISEEQTQDIQKLSDITISLSWETSSNCTYKAEVCLVLVDEFWNVKMFLKPYGGVFEVSDDLDDFVISDKIVDGNNTVITMDTKEDSILYSQYFIFYYNTRGNDHNCKNINMSYINNETGKIRELNTLSGNSPCIKSLKDCQVDQKLPKEIYDYENEKIQLDVSGNKILPLFIIDFLYNTIEMQLYVYNDKKIPGPVSDELDKDAEDPILIREIPDYGPPIPFSLRYQTYNATSYTWYVSFVYPGYVYGYKPKLLKSLIPYESFIEESDVKEVNLVLKVGDEEHCNNKRYSNMIMLNDSNKVIAQYRFDQFYIDDSYIDKIKIIKNDVHELEISLPENDNKYYIITFNFRDTSSTIIPDGFLCSHNQYTISKKQVLTNSIIEDYKISNFDCYHMEYFDTRNLIGTIFNFSDYQDKLGSNIQPNITITNEEIIFIHDLNKISNEEIVKGDQESKTEPLIIEITESDIQDIHRKNEEIQIRNQTIASNNLTITEQNEEINKENLKYKNNSYFVWQYGKEIDGSDFIKRHKGYDSPIFANFFHNFKIYDDAFDYSWNPITYYITWNEQSCSFLFCEDPILGDTVHGFSYFGALNNFNQKLKDDYSGNFGSFGNNLLDADWQSITIPEFSGELETYSAPKYNINVYFRIYFGDYLVPLSENFQIPILSFIDSETLYDPRDLINIRDIDEINNLPNKYHLTNSKDLEFDRIEVVEDGDTYNYYIVYNDTTYVEPELTPIEIKDKIEIYKDDEELVIPIKIENIDSFSEWIPKVELNINSATNSNINVLLNDEGNLEIKPNGSVGSVEISLESKATINKYDIDIEIDYDTKISKIITWNFSDFTIDEGLS